MSVSVQHFAEMLKGEYQYLVPPICVDSLLSRDFYRTVFCVDHPALLNKLARRDAHSDDL